MDIEYTPEYYASLTNKRTKTNPYYDETLTYLRNTKEGKPFFGMSSIPIIVKLIASVSIWELETKICRVYASAVCGFLDYKIYESEGLNEHVIRMYKEIKDRITNGSIECNG